MTSIAELTFQLIPADPKEELHGWSYHIYIPRLRDERDLVNAQVGRCLTIGDDAYLSTVVWEGGGEDFQSFKWIASVKRPKPGSQGAYEFTRERMVERIEMLKEALALERRIRGASSGSC